MKKFIRFSIPALVIAAFFINSAGITSAQTLNTSTNANVDLTTYDATFLNDLSADASVRAEVDATIKAENDRCQKTTDRTQKNDCFRNIGNKIKAKFPNAFIKSIRNSVAPKVNADIRQNAGSDKTTFWTALDVRAMYRSIIDRITNNFANSRSSLDAAYDRISQIANRIEERLSKLDASKTDVSAQLKLLASAREELRLAKVAIEASKTSFSADMSFFTKDSDVEYSTNLFARCKADGYPVAETAPARCKAPNGITYVNSDVRPQVTGPIRHSFMETTKFIEEAKTHLKLAHKYLVQIISGVKGSDVRTNTQADVRSSTNGDATIPATN